jgi:hypothetical protein
MIELIWSMMRDAAISRHRIVNLLFENGDPTKWEPHMIVIRKFYD